jgi:hypothetical protein
VFWSELALALRWVINLEMSALVKAVVEEEGVVWVCGGREVVVDDVTAAEVAGAAVFDCTLA